MTSKEKALLATTLMNTIFQEYKANELNRHGELIWSRCGRFLRSSVKNNRESFIEIVLKSDKAWRATINHYAAENMRIEAKSTIMAIFNYFEDDLKHADIRNKHLEEWTKEMTPDAEAEHNSKTVIDYMAEQLGLPKLQSAFKTKFASQ